MNSKNYEKIAVVGIGSLFPDANNTDEFWQNIINKKVSIRELPEELFEKEIYYRPELLKSFNKQNKSYTQIAAYISDVDFNTVRKFKIPPSVAEHMDPNQHAALYTADEALKDVNLQHIAKERISVIYGNGSVGTRYGDALVGVQYDKIKHFMKKHPLFKGLSIKEQDDLFEYIRVNAVSDSIPITEDTAPGILPNIIAARVSNVFGFNGPSYTTDSACASSLTALIGGIKGLRLNEYDVAVCGGSDMPIKALGLIFFSAINALSPDGSFPFDIRANGFVMGQGSGTVILKRLSDAIRDNDKIYALINGYGEASDGKGKYIAAPNADWQAYSIVKACKMAGYPVDTIELVEAHGTGTTVGDVVELEGLKKAFGKLGFSKNNYCGISSVKSNIGHLKSAAGIAGFIKAVLSLYNKKLPATANLETVNPKLGLDDSPFYILDETHDWKENPNYPRRANVSAFGFGGSDYHLALEEYRENDYTNNEFSIASTNFQNKEELIQKVEVEKEVNNILNVVYFSSDSIDNLTKVALKFIDEISKQKLLEQHEYLKIHNINQNTANKFRVAFLFNTFADLNTKITFFQKNHNTFPKEVLQSKGIYFKVGDRVSEEQIAIMFPGQAAQYANMFLDLYNNSDVFKNKFDQADAYWFKKYGYTVSSLIYGDENILNKKLKETQNTHPAVFITSYALFELMSSLGLKSKYMLGHSLGEITALACSQILDFKDAIELVDARGFAFVDAQLKDKGKMLSVSLDYDSTQKILNDIKINGISISNINSNKQTIIAGNSKGIDELNEYFKTKNIPSKQLNVSHAFHSDLMKPVAELFNKRINNFKFNASHQNVMINHLGEFYPSTKKSLGKIKNIIVDQIINPVNFVKSIEKLKDEGVKLFLEIGPNSILGSLSKNILKDSKLSIISSNFNKSNSIQSLQKLAASLFAEGINIIPFQSKVLNKASIPKSIVSNSENNNKNSSSVSVVYSGVSIGLPGSFKEMFQEDNFNQIFEGRNFIERLTDEEKQKLVDLNITKLVKDEKGPVFNLISSLDDVIQLAGKSGKLDIVNDYHLDKSEIKKTTKTISMGIAAAYEALKDAKIPLVQEFKKTRSGKYLPAKLALPKEMQEDTGVIFANGFPMVDPIIEEVSRHVAYKYGSKTVSELIHFYESIIEKVKDKEAKNLLRKWFSLYYSKLTQNISQNDIYKFNYNFITRISSQANNRIAQLINAKGPNFQMNAACSSTSNAIAIAEDFIKSGRAKRMIVVGADDATSNINMPYLGAGFLSSGAASNEADLYKAAVPFDIKRNGMIMSAAAVGIILESKKEVEKRGVIELCELLGSHSFNTANHPSQIDSKGFSHELNKFISKIESKYNLQRKDMAKDLIYISHETYTPPRGGCSQTEAIALSETFKENVKSIVIGNTKGMTGHAMGAALEEAVAAKSLQYGKIPPVVNLTEMDPLLSDINISTGGDHNRNYALRMSAGFGAQGNYILLKKVAEGNSRIFNLEKYRTWLSKISENKNAKESFLGKILIVEPSTFNTSEGSNNIISDQSESEELKEVKVEIPTHDKLIEFLSDLTKYPPEMLEDEMELKADIGLDENKLKEIIQAFENKFSVEILNVNIENTIGDLFGIILNSSNQKIQESFSTGQKDIDEIDIAKFDTNIKDEIIKIFSEVTKYPEDMLELDMEMEADLGIDTVKQATILSMIGEKYHLERDEDLRLSDFPTIGHIINLVHNNGEYANKEELINNGNKSNSTQEKFEIVQISPDEDVVSEVIKVFSEVTKYPEDMLELDMEMEADLGIDTVKQATILSILGEKYMLEQNDDLKLSDFPTIGHIINLIKENGKVFSQNEIEGEIVEEREYNNAEHLKSNPSQNQETELSRQAPILVPSKLSRKKYSIENKNILIIGNYSDTINNLKNFFKEKNANLQTFVFPKSAVINKINTTFNKIKFIDKLNIVIDTTMILSGTKKKNQKNNSIDYNLFTKTKNRFLLFRKLIEKKFSPEKLICLISEDGQFGYNNNLNITVDPINAALNGFYKSLRKEIGTELKVIDFSQFFIGKNPEIFKRNLLNEIEKYGEGIEIGYSNNTRKVIKISDDVEFKISEMNLNENDTILVTGGANGITSEIVKEFAKKYKTNFVLIGRSKIPNNIAELSKLTKNEFEGLRENIRKRLEKEQSRVTPKMINDEYDKLQKAVIIYNNIKEIGEERVKYISTDITKITPLKRELSKLDNKFKFVTGLIHGAGIDKSNLIDRKSFNDFNLVFDTKVKGAINLEQIIDVTKLKFAIAISSISGRFGNAAQTDYSSANNFLSSWIIKLSRINPKMNAFSFLTSGWKEIGMAWRNTFVREGSDELGLNLIEPKHAVKSFLDELNFDHSGQEIIIHKGLNGFIEKGLSVSKVENYPLLDRLVKKGKNDYMAFRMFSVKRDAFIDQHRLGTTPIMPAVGYSEIGAEFYSQQTGQSTQFMFERISFENPFKLFKEKSRELFITGKQKSVSSWQFEISSKFSLANSDISNTICHSKMIINSQLGSYKDMNPANWNIDQKNTISLSASESLMLIEGDGPKQRIILGPLYNDIVRDENDKTPVIINENSVVYPTRFPLEQLTNKKYPLKSLLINPCFLDSLYQACAAHLLVTKKRVYLPWIAENLGIVDVPREDGLYTCYGQIIEENDEIVKYRVTMLDDNKNIRYFVRNIEFRRINL